MGVYNFYINTALAGLLDRNKLTHQDIKNVFEGYEAHHVIPANFLYNNDYINELLAQDGITFGFNDLDNLVYIPTDKHRENGQFCHNDYDDYIDNEINTRLAASMDKGNYEGALKELKEIIEETKERFKNEVLKPNGITLDKM